MPVRVRALLRLVLVSGRMWWWYNFRLILLYILLYPGTTYALYTIRGHLYDGYRWYKIPDIILVGTILQDTGNVLGISDYTSRLLRSRYKVEVHPKELKVRRGVGAVGQHHLHRYIDINQLHFEPDCHPTANFGQALSLQLSQRAHETKGKKDSKTKSAV